MYAQDAAKDATDAENAAAVLNDAAQDAEKDAAAQDAAAVLNCQEKRKTANAAKDAEKDAQDAAKDAKDAEKDANAAAVPVFRKLDKTI